MISLKNVYCVVSLGVMFFLLGLCLFYGVCAVDCGDNYFLRIYYGLKVLLLGGWLLVFCVVDYTVEDYWRCRELRSKIRNIK